jgi:archaetidylinositol phosphate synthase
MAMVIPPPAFKPATRTQESLLAPLESQTLRWLAAHMPRAVNSDHLTILGGLAMVAVGGCFWANRWSPYALLGVALALGLNWFGDSLDGTLARYRNQQRPRYGFYVDHIIDAMGTLCLFGGLALGGLMSPIVAAAVVIAFYLLSIEAYLATYTVANFRLSHFKFGPTELRVLLAIGALVAITRPVVHIASHQCLLFDVGGVIASVGMLFIFGLATIRTTARLYREEPLP